MTCSYAEPTNAPVGTRGHRVRTVLEKGQASVTAPTTSDPITTEIIRNFFQSCAQDMNATLFRSAYTPVIYEGLDCAVALLDENADVLGQAAGVPLFVGNLEVCVKLTTEAFGIDVYEPGDIFYRSLEAQIAERGVPVRLHVMQSNGGVMTSTAAQRIPIQTLLSGPVGGTIGGRALSEALDRPNLLCVDMGGTSFDVSLIVDRNLSVSTETALEGFQPVAANDVEPQRRRVVFAGTAHDASIYQRDTLPRGFTFTGPAILEEETVTTAVPPGWQGQVDELGNLILTPTRSK